MDEFASSIPVTLRGIYLRASNVSMKDDFDPFLPGGQQLSGVHRIKNQDIIDRVTNVQDAQGNQSKLTSLCFNTSFEFLFINPDQLQSIETVSDPEYLIRISADIAVDYLIDSNRPMDQNEMQLWGAKNVLLHAWPYWREFQQSTIWRMNLPPSIIPLLTPDLFLNLINIPDGTSN